MKNIYLIIALLCFVASPVSSIAAETVGHIQTLRGTVSIIRGDKSLTAATGTTLNCGDMVRTGKPGAVGIIMADHTSISLGPDSEITIKDYAFNPKEGKFSLVARMTKGTFAYLSGLIGKLSPNSIQLMIPDATIAVRGTKLLIEIEP